MGYGVPILFAFPILFAQHNQAGTVSGRRTCFPAGTFLGRSVKLSSMIVLQFGVPGGPELVVLGLILLVIPFFMAYWVYTDAEGRGDGNAALWALAVGGLTYLTLFGGFLALAVYIWQRE